MSRTNFVKVSNLPPYLQTAVEIHSVFSTCGLIQDITAVDPTTVIVSYSNRSSPEYAEFALSNGVTIGGSPLQVQRYFPATDPQFLNNPAYHGLGQFIGQDHHVMNINTFQPLQPPQQGGARNKSSSHQPGPGPGFAPAPPHQQPVAGASGGDLISANTLAWTGGGGDRDECAICLADNDASSLTLSQCGHSYHRACLQQLINSSAREFLQCPTCKKVYGVKTGTMPTTGSISHRLLATKLPGHESSQGCIEITFNFAGGLQGQEHPNPGHPYHASSFPRTAFLPDSAEGEQALHGIYMAWAQRLMFTVGQSITTGRDNCITWNDIHMKTNPNGGAHGYPDPSYLKNLLDDLSGFGITDAAISENLRKHPDLKTRGRL